MFSIITPTIGRPSLLKTCETINNQTCSDWEHLVIYDGPECEVDVFKQIAHPQRRILFSGRNFGDYGHSIRYFAWELTTYDRLMYIDDDDCYHLECLKTVKEVIDPEINFIFFPALRMGELFMNLPPRRNFTVSCQYVHTKRDLDGAPIRFPPGGHDTDSRWIGQMAEKYPYQVIDTNGCPLVYVDMKSDGK